MTYSTELSISVIVPVHNGGASFHRCLLRLAETVPPPSEIIVVADGDTDGSWLLAKEFSTKVLKVSERGGPAQARNLGARAAQGDILFFVDADVVISPEAIRQVAIAFQREPDLAALIGSYDDAPGASNFLSQYKNLFHHYTHQTACEEASTFWGACGAIRREIFLGIGGFDESYRQPSIEDIELGYRLKRSGYRIRLHKTLQVKHLKRWGITSLLKADFYYRALPWTELILRDRQFTNDLNLQFSNRLSVILVYGLLGTLVGAWWWSGFLTGAGVLSLGLLVLNAPVYRFFLDKRGFLFTLQVVPWHWFYYLYSGLAFAIGTSRYLFNHWYLSRASLSMALRK